MEADECYIVDLGAGRIVSGPHEVPGSGPGLKRLGSLAFRWVPRGVGVFIVSKIGTEGVRLLEEMGARAEVFNGGLDELLEAGERGLVEHFEPSKDCPCCSLEGSNSPAPGYKNSRGSH